MIMNYVDNAKKYGNFETKFKSRKAENCDQRAFSWQIPQHKVKHRQYKNIITTFFDVAKNETIL